MGFPLSDDRGPSGPPRLGLCPSELLSASSPPRAPDSHRKGDYSVSLAIYAPRPTSPQPPLGHSYSNQKQQLWSPSPTRALLFQARHKLFPLLLMSYSCVQIPSRIPLSFCKRKLVTVFQKLLEPLSRCSFLLWLQPFVFWELLDSSWSAPSNDAQVEATMVNVFLPQDWLNPHVTLEGGGGGALQWKLNVFLFYILGANRIP